MTSGRAATRPRRTSGSFSSFNGVPLLIFDLGLHVSLIGTRAAFDADDWQFSQVFAETFPGGSKPLQFLTVGGDDAELVRGVRGTAHARLPYRGCGRTRVTSREE